MSSHPNVERMKAGYDAFAKGDLDALRELFAPDIVWHESGDWPLAGDYKGVDEVFGFFGQLLSMSEGLEQNILDLFASERRGVAVLEATLKVKGASHTGLQAHIFEFNDEGRVTEFWNCVYDSDAFEALLK